MTQLVVLYGLLGAIVGSFLNVVIIRYNTGNSIQGRSACLSCSHPLAWYDLVPILSFIALRGRCRYCKSALSWQYPMVEVLTVLLFAAVALFTLTSITPAAIIDSATLLVVVSLLVVIGTYDIRHTIIPDAPVYLLIFLSIGLLFFEGGVFAMPSLSAALSGPIVALPLALLWLISRGKWMGLGDAKLALGLGWLLSLSGAFTMLVLSFWIGAFISILRLLVPFVVHGIQLFGDKRHLTMKSADNYQ